MPVFVCSVLKHPSLPAALRSGNIKDEMDTYTQGFYLGSSTQLLAAEHPGGWLGHKGLFKGESLESLATPLGVTLDDDGVVL